MRMRCNLYWITMQSASSYHVFWLKRRCVLHQITTHSELNSVMKLLELKNTPYISTSFLLFGSLVYKISKTIIFTANQYSSNVEAVYEDREKRPSQAYSIVFSLGWMTYQQDCINDINPKGNNVKRWEECLIMPFNHRYFDMDNIGIALFSQWDWTKYRGWKYLQSTLWVGP